MALFMIHEFEEIALVRTWLLMTEGRPEARDMWSTRRWAYPSTEAIALMIAEVFLLVSLIVGFGVALGWPELIVGAFILHGLHLLVHMADAMRVGRWSPGSVTAIATLPLLAATIWWFTLGRSLNWGWVAATTVIVAAIVFPNLIVLHHLAPRLHGFISSAYRRADILPGAQSTPVHMGAPRTVT
jgi:hypothetical protein